MTKALEAFAKARFALSKIDSRTGKTRHQILLDIRKQTGVVAPELKELPSLPTSGAHIWQWFEDLEAKRTAGFSLNPLTWSDIHAYFALMGISPARWEIRAIARLDDAFIASRIDPVSSKVVDAKTLKHRMTGKAAE